jgi:hypothetical protein
MPLDPLGVGPSAEGARKIQAISLIITHHAHLEINLGAMTLTVALKELADDEKFLRERILERLNRHAPESKIDWLSEVRLAFRGSGGSQFDEDAGREQAEALRKLYREKLSVLTGRAGTGKTWCLLPFLNIIEKQGLRPAEWVIST